MTPKGQSSEGIHLPLSAGRNSTLHGEVQETASETSMKRNRAAALTLSPARLQRRGGHHPWIESVVVARVIPRPRLIDSSSSLRRLLSTRPSTVPLVQRERTNSPDPTTVALPRSTQTSFSPTGIDGRLGTLAALSLRLRRFLRKRTSTTSSSCFNPSFKEAVLDN